MKLPFEPELEEKNEPWDVKNQWSKVTPSGQKQPSFDRYLTEN